MIFSSTKTSEGWDGSINGRQQPVGIYLWVTEGIGINGKPIKKKGAVMLLR